MGRLGAGGSWQQENGSFCSCTLVQHPENRWAGTSSDRKGIWAWSTCPLMRTGWVKVAGASTFADQTYRLRRFAACQGLRSGMLLSSPGTITPCHPHGHWWASVATLLWSLGWRAWEHRRCFLMFLLVQEWMHPVGWQVQSDVKRNKVLLNVGLYTMFLINN